MSKVAGLPFWTYHRFTLTPFRIRRLTSEGKLPLLVDAVGSILGRPVIKIDRVNNDQIMAIIHRGTYDETVTLSPGQFASFAGDYQWQTPNPDHRDRIEKESVGA